MAAVPAGEHDFGNVTLITTMGDIELQLYYKHAPNTCRNFHELAKRGYYDNTLIFRVVRDFVVQGGDPTGTGRGGESIYGSEFRDEIHPQLRHTGAGILSMANSGPNSNRSQFFITLGPAPHLDGKHTIFGRVLSGMEAVKKIGQVQVDSRDRPIFDIKLAYDGSSSAYRQQLSPAAFNDFQRTAPIRTIMLPGAELDFSVQRRLDVLELIVDITSSTRKRGCILRANQQAAVPVDSRTAGPKRQDNETPIHK